MPARVPSKIRVLIRVGEVGAVDNNDVSVFTMLWVVRFERPFEKLHRDRISTQDSLIDSVCAEPIAELRARSVSVVECFEVRDPGRYDDGLQIDQVLNERL